MRWLQALRDDQDYHCGYNPRGLLGEPVAEDYEEGKKFAVYIPTQEIKIGPAGRKNASGQ